MKIALLGTGFGQVHAAVYAERSDVDQVVVFGRTAQKLVGMAEQFAFATTTDLDAILDDPDVDLVDICLPTNLHAEVGVRAMQAAHDILIELPLATNLDDGRRIISVQKDTGRRAFVDMFSRFSAHNQYLRQAVADGRYGPLLAFEVEGHTARLWEGYDLGLETLALDMMHADFDLVTSLLGRPDTVEVAGIDGLGGQGSAAEVVLSYPTALARCTSSSLMPTPYGMHGGYRATFVGAVLEYVVQAGFTGEGPSTLTEHTLEGTRLIELTSTSPYTVMIDHVLACLDGRAENLIEPASALLALELTLDVHQRLNQQRPGAN